MTEDDMIIQSLRRDLESQQQICALLKKEIRRRDEEIAKLLQRYQLKMAENMKLRRMIEAVEDGKAAD